MEDGGQGRVGLGGVSSLFSILGMGGGDKIDVTPFVLLFRFLFSVEAQIEKKQRSPGGGGGGDPGSQPNKPDPPSSLPEKEERRSGRP